MKSWKTTIVGFLSGIILMGTQVRNVLDEDPDTNFDLNAFLSGLALMGIGVAARDNNKSSEQVGVKK